jgi:hypothetical protein
MASLDADRKLLKRFVKWVGLKKPTGRLYVLQQSVPGEILRVVDQDETQRRGLPDGWIHDADEWSLLVESKVAAFPSDDQIRRHLRTARRRGYPNPNLLWLTVTPVEGRMRRGVINRTWAQLYSWLIKQGEKSEWARHAAQYFEVAEVQADMKAQLKEGTLTRFAGIPFDENNPYSYSQAKRLLGLLRGKLLQRRDLERHLGMNRRSPGRGAITGRTATSVWDFISINTSRGDYVFTQNLHLTLGISDERVDAYVTVPNNIRTRLRKALLGGRYEDFYETIAEVTRRLTKALRSYPGGRPLITVVQRRFASQRSEARHDAVLRFDPRTAVRVSGKGGGPAVRLQPEWLLATERALRYRGSSNLQLQIGAEFPYTKCDVTRSADLVNAVADVWLACKPVLLAIESGKTHGRPRRRRRRTIRSTIR